MTHSPYFAAIDLGSNSFHMLVGRVVEGQLEVVDREKEMVQIARGLDENGNLDDEAKERALSCLHRFSERLRDIPAEQIRAVGTKTLRAAHNSRAFLREAESQLGQPIQIISGYEEARLVYTGLSHSVANDHIKRLVIDIGGGSTEFIIGEDDTPELLESLSLGCVTFTNNYFRSGIPFERSMRNAYMAACAEIELIRTQYVRKGWTLAYGTSGTIKAIGSILNEKSLIIDKEGIHSLMASTIANGGIQDKAFSKLRREVLPAGIAILNAIFDQLDLDSIQVSTASLKDGLIFDTVGRFGQSDIRELTVNKLIQRYNVDADQAARVNDFALMFWSSIKNQLPNIAGVSRTKVLKWAAQLHEIGLNISHSSYHHHGHYLLQHSDLGGFGRYEQSIVASLVHMHRKKVKSEQMEHIHELARPAFLALLVCLRLAVHLNRRRETLDIAAKFELKDDQFLLEIDPEWLASNPLTYAGLKREQGQLANVGLNLELVGDEGAS